jgi:fructosamine-3-kinase
MCRTDGDRLAAQFDSYQVVRQLHDVPPHEVYEVRVDGRRAVYKRDTGPTGSAEREGRATRFVGETTSVPVPTVLAVGADYYVAAWHPDAPAADTEGRADEQWAEAAGRGLATLHAETAPHLDGYGALDLGGGTPTATPTVTHEDWHAAALDYVRERRSVLAAYGHRDLADAVLDCLRERPGLFADGVVPVLCHGWWSPEHVAVEDGTVACVVDFEHALAAPGEFDVWRTALSVFEGGSGARFGAFREGYESVRGLPDGFESRRPLYAALHGVYFLESLYVQDQHGEAGTQQRADWLREAVFESLDALA